MRIEIGCLLGSISLLALEDLRMKKIPIIPLILTGIIGMIFHLIFESRDIKDILGGMFIGVVLYAVSFFTKGKVGKGDAFLFMVTGVYLGFWNNLLALWIASVIAGVIGVGIIVVKNKRFDYKLPFVPFVLVAIIMLLLIGGGKFA